MRVILVPVADRPECVYALEAAFRIASAQEASVVGCHVRPHRDEKVPFNSAASRALFLRAAGIAGFTLSRRSRLGKPGLAIWREMMGTPERVLTICGPMADLSVLSRPKPKGAGRARAFLLATLFNSGRPVLVLPQRRVRHLGRRILIAWNQRREAALAVAAALPMLQRAEQVTIASCGVENRIGPKSTQLCDYLRHWGVRAGRVRSRGRDVPAELTNAYAEMRADLLVMGAYSRSRFSERVFGGATEAMLFRSQLPVLMYHT